MAESQRLSFEELAAINRKLDRQLKDLQSSKKKRFSTDNSFRIAYFVKRLLLACILLIAPFFLLIRSSVFIYFHYQINGWLSLTVGAMLTFFLLFLYICALVLRYGKNPRLFSLACRGAACLIIAYMLYGLLYYSSISTKTPDIRDHYQSMHPILRVTLATVSLADSQLLVTDIYRTAEDYTAMGLQENRHSLHYIQNTGYVHAADIRTVERSFIKNFLTDGTLKLLGLRTIRHTGTADHLHVYLPLND